MPNDVFNEKTERCVLNFEKYYTFHVYKKPIIFSK